MPRRFAFDLEPVLSVRRIEEDAKKRAFAEASRRVDEQGALIDAIERDQRDARERFARTRAAGVGMMQLRLEEGYLLGLERRLRRESAELVKRLSVREARRVEFVEARRKVRLLEKLRQKRLAEWRRGAEREEQKFLDEAGALMHARRPEEVA
jgi:flagellar FliJ protein